MAATSPSMGERWGVSRPGVLRTSPFAAAALLVALVGGCTVVVDLVTPRVPADAAGVIYLVGVLGVSTASGVWWGLLASLASALAFNFFFLPPAHTLVINSSSDWAALAVFALTAVVTSKLSSQARRERDEAARRAEEARLSESFATLVAEARDVATALPALADQAARALGAGSGVIRRGETAAPAQGGAVLTLELQGRWMGELWLFGAPPAVLGSPAARRIARSLAGLIALGEERDRRLAQQIQTEALARSNELKTALLRAVSHDLRSPLMAITTAGGGLHYAKLDGDERELLETIIEQSARMSRMIENLLDLSKLQAGATAGRSEWLDPRELIEASVAEVAENGVGGDRIALDFAPAPALVMGDAAQLQRVLVNLLENALKFSSAGSPVRVSLRNDGGEVEVAVADQGPGIPAAESERIFEPFSRLARPGDAPGSGLGLAIARGLAEANGGRLTVTSEAGHGSRFVLHIPVPER
jgi:two-component system sensor histidine kinase KdpD